MERRLVVGKSYSDKLSDPRWQRKRLEIYQRDNFTCTLCADMRTTLAVHHEEYKGEPWNISNDKLHTVCAHCHDVIHHLKGYEIEGIYKRISLNARCWEVVAFTTTDIIFLYLFFNTYKHEIISIIANNNINSLIKAA